MNRLCRPGSPFRFSIPVCQISQIKKPKHTKPRSELHSEITVTAIILFFLVVSLPLSLVSLTLTLTLTHFCSSLSICKLLFFYVSSFPDLTGFSQKLHFSVDWQTYFFHSISFIFCRLANLSFFCRFLHGSFTPGEVAMSPSPIYKDDEGPEKDDSLGQQRQELQRG